MRALAGLMGMASSLLLALAFILSAIAFASHFDFMEDVRNSYAWKCRGGRVVVDGSIVKCLSPDGTKMKIGDLK
jgi:hypothetical protein